MAVLKLGFICSVTPRMIAREVQVTMKVRKMLVAVLLLMIIALTVGISYVTHDLTAGNKNAEAAMKPSSFDITSSFNATSLPSPVPTSTTVTPSVTPTSTPSTTQPSTGSISVVSVALQPFYPPAGPMIEVTLQNVGSKSVTSLQAMLAIESACTGKPFNFTFSQVSMSNPLLPGQETAQTETLIGGGFNSNQTYPLEIIAYQQNGAKIDFTTQVTISSATT